LAYTPWNVKLRPSSFYLEAVRIALQSIFAHKLRAFLTLIGIIIGVASVVVVGAAISGMRAYVLERVAKILGVNHFMIARMAASGNVTEEQWERMNRRNPRLEWDDVDWLTEQCSSCEEVGAQANSRTDLKVQGVEMLGVQVAGVTASMGKIEDKTIEEGRFLLPHEVSHPTRVCVIGADVRQRFFPERDPLGKTLKVRGVDFRIVGVEARRGSMLGQSLDNQMYIPISTFQQVYGRTQSLQIHGLAQTREGFPDTIEQARVSMRIHHKLKGNEDDDFGLVNVEELNQGVDQFTGAVTMVVTPITLISLVVGGIVVMNIMLVTVNERTFEVGLRKAIGARRRQILIQFLIESALLCALGGVLGLMLSAGISGIIRAATPVPMTITVGYILLALVVSSVVGILAGLYPAWKAAKLDPVVALSRT
jgi:putative ABC transport system permease protein